MKQNTRFKKLLKQSFCVTLAVIAFFVYGLHDPYSIYAVITADENEQGYKWTRIKNQTQLENTVSEIHDTLYSKMDRNYNNNNYWTRVMLVWQSGDDYYFASQGAGSEDDDWYGKAVLAGYGIDLTKDVFYTRTGLDTPYIKECVGGQNSSYEKEHAYCFRLCETGTEKMTDFVASCELNFFGVAYHAATRAQFTFYSKINDKNCRPWKSSASSNDDRLLTVNMRFTSSWADYFNKYGITEKQKNALLVAFEHSGYYYHENNSYSPDTHMYSTEELIALGGFDSYYALRKKVGEQYFFSIGSYVEINYHKYYLRGLYTNEERIAYALEKCTDPDIYDTSIFTKIYKTDEYPGGISGADAFAKLFEPMCKAYEMRTGFREEGQAYFYYDFNGNIVKRYWVTSGNKISIQSDLSSGTYRFIVYLGEPYNIPRYRSTDKLPVGLNVFGYNTQIDNGAVVTVGVGSTLVIEKHVYNNGTIIVDGGTLIITGILDTDPKTTIVGNPYIPTNKLIIKNGGICTIADTGSFIARDSNAYISVSGNSTLQVDGVIVTPALSISQYSTLRANHGSAIYVGVKSKDLISTDYFDATKIRGEKKNTTINSIVDNCVNILNETANFIINGQSSMTSDGFVYINGTSYYGNDCAWSFWRETDSNRTIKDGMRVW